MLKLAKQMSQSIAVGILSQMLVKSYFLCLISLKALLLP